MRNVLSTVPQTTVPGTRSAGSPSHASWLRKIEIWLLALSGLFIPLHLLPEWLRHFPLTYAVSLLQGIWKGEPWSAHLGDVGVLVLVFVVCTALSAKIFRWE